MGPECVLLDVYIPCACCPPGMVYSDRDDAVGLFAAIQRRCTICFLCCCCSGTVLYFLSSAAGSDVTLDTLFLLFLHVLSVMTGW